MFQYLWLCTNIYRLQSFRCTSICYFNENRAISINYSNELRFWAFRSDKKPIKKLSVALLIVIAWLTNENVIHSSQLSQLHCLAIVGSEIVMNWTATKAPLSQRLLICVEQNARAPIQMSSSSWLKWLMRNTKVKFFFVSRELMRSFMLIWCTYAILFHETIQLRSAQNAIFTGCQQQSSERRVDV